MTSASRQSGRACCVGALLVLGMSVAGCSTSGSTANPIASRPASAVIPGAALGLITEPRQGITPILDQIKGAKHSVDLVMYELSDSAIESALAADAHRGVKVRVLLNGGYYGAGGFSENDAAFSYLKSHDVPVRATPSSFALTHQKTVIIDGDVADIMTLNLTPQYYSTSRDFAVVDRQPRDVAAIEATFGADWSGTRISPTTGTGDLVWSPGALPDELAVINGAKHSLLVENEEMDDSSVTDALAAAARRGVDVKVVMTADSGWDSAFSALTAAGVHVRTYAEEAPLYIHAKVIVADAKTALVGSQNFSPTSLDDNRELGIRVTNAAILRSLSATLSSDYSGAAPFAQTPTTTTTSSSGATGCTVSATYSSYYHDWDVYVRDAPPDTEATATADGYSASYRTDSSGYADIYFKAPESAAGSKLRVTVGSASCGGTL